MIHDQVSGWRHTVTPLSIHCLGEQSTDTHVRLVNDPRFAVEFNVSCLGSSRESKIQCLDRNQPLHFHVRTLGVVEFHRLGYLHPTILSVRAVKALP